MRIEFLKNVTLLGAQPQLGFACVVAFQVLEEKGCTQCVITAVTNGKHMTGSRHYFGLAIDIDPIGFTPAQMREAAKEIARRLPDEFDVIGHDSHVHIEWDVKN